MSNLFQIGATDSCGGFLPIVKVLANVIKLIQIIVRK